MRGIRGCSQKHFQNVLSFSKHQIWCPSPLGWNRVNCLAKQNGLGLKHVQQFLISFWFLLLVSSQQHFEIGVQNTLSFSKYSFIFKMCFYFQKFKFGVQAPLVEIWLTIWQKMGTGLKHGQKFIYILISTFSLHCKKGMQPTTFFKRAFIFKSSNLVSKPPWLRLQERNAANNIF